MKQNEHESATDFGSFHENEIVRICEKGDLIALTIVEKTCADTENERKIVRKLGVHCQGVLAKHLSSSGRKVEWTILSPNRDVDLSIIHLQASSNPDCQTLTIYCEGFVNNKRYDSLKLDLSATEIQFVNQSSVLAEQNDRFRRS